MCSLDFQTFRLGSNSDILRRDIWLSPWNLKNDEAFLEVVILWLVKKYHPFSDLSKSYGYFVSAESLDWMATNLNTHESLKTSYWMDALV